MPGIDVIAWPARGRYREARWRARIAAPTERAWLAQHPSPAWAGLQLWAAKEAAYKALAHHAQPQGAFSPTRLHIVPQGAGFAWHDQQQARQGVGRWYWGAGYLLALALDRATPWEALRWQLVCQPGLTAPRRSAAGRALLLQLVRSWSVPSHAPWQLRLNSNGAPLVSMDHVPWRLPASLSHDGTWLAAALTFDSHDASP